MAFSFLKNRTMSKHEEFIQFISGINFTQHVISQIRINLHTIDFVFDNDIIVQTACQIIYKRNNKIIQIWRSGKNQAIIMNDIIETPILKINIGKDKSLSFIFQNLLAIEIVPSSNIHESYIIYTSKDFIVV